MPLSFHRPRTIGYLMGMETQSLQPSPLPGVDLPPFNIMAKPVCGVCNLNCEYCYYTCKPRQLYGGVEPSQMRMSEELLDSYVRQYTTAQPARADFGWQGGEPTLAGLDFFRRAVELEEQYAQEGQIITNALQTNGTLLNDEWCEFLAEKNFLVGLSLDGPPAWHDHFRKDHAGLGSFGRAWAGLECLRKHGVEHNVLVTLNSRNAPYAGDIYRYFVNRGVNYLQFIPVLEKDEHGEPTEYSCSGEQFGKFLVQVFDAWAAGDVGKVSVRFFDSVLHAMIYGTATVCCESTRCANAHVLEWNGDLYACDHFCDPQWKLGNILETPLVELLQKPLLTEDFARLKTDRPEPCNQCEFLRLCWGGCPKHHLHRDGDVKVNHFCAGYKMFFRHAVPEFERIAQYVSKGQLPPPKDAPAAPAGRRPHPMPAKPPGRNEPCPCGSGRKFKHCCGKR